MKNPFKFGPIVSDPHFTNRTKEIQQVKSTLESENHLIIVSPRRFGKTSLVRRVTEKMNRPVLFIDLMLVNSVNQFANLILKRTYKAYPFEKIKAQIKSFRVIPGISMNPVTGAVDVQFSPQSEGGYREIEDVLNLIDKLGSSRKKPIVIFDEFQEINRVDKNLINQLRSIMQEHENVNYLFMGSQESMIESIFLRKKSPFYHFGALLRLNKIPNNDFLQYLTLGFSSVSKRAKTLAEEILKLSLSHPYYTQQLAYFTWEVCSPDEKLENPVAEALKEIIHNQDNNYERLWMNFNNTDRRIMMNLSMYKLQPLSSEFLLKTGYMPASTASSSLRKLSKEGFLIKEGSNYSFEDPFFGIWLKWRQDKEF